VPQRALRMRTTPAMAAVTVPAISRVLGTRASLEGELDHPEAVAEFERTALRLRYARPDPPTL
jgi:hypothetical protein